MITCKSSLLMAKDLLAVLPVIACYCLVAERQRFKGANGTKKAIY